MHNEEDLLQAIHGAVDDVNDLLPEEASVFVRRLKIHCAKRMSAFKVPVKVALSSEHQHSDRFKKKRIDLSTQ